ncbi:hypothetical protein H0E87_018527 [Populus deltoides]|uniref:Cytochrome P450 n=1 Tax=Populus deltoides TaxID=3696 RepID=A0A8T2XT34_POPDE|nr:hypothetical protein H0E87_018527 [Populus deltoides]
MALYAVPLWLPLILLLPLLLLFMKRMKDAGQSEQLLPPGPPKLPILGNLHQLSSLPHQSMWHLSRKYGPVMLLRLGQIPTVVISSAEAAREVLKVHDLAFCSRPLLSGAGRLTYNYLDIAFSPYSDHWRNMRKIVTLELFSLERVQSFRFIREEEVGFLVNSLSESSALAAPVDLTQKVYALVGNITFRVAYGFDYRGTSFDRDRFHEVVHDTEAVVGSISADEYIPYLGWIDHDDMIDVLLRIEKERTGLGASQFTRDNIKAILLAYRQHKALLAFACRKQESIHLVPYSS